MSSHQLKILTFTTMLLMLLNCVSVCATQSAPQVRQLNRASSTTSSTTSMPSIENPTELEATSESSEEDQYRCFDCYGKITEAQRMLVVYENLQSLERKHLKDKAAKVATLASNSKNPKQGALSTRNQSNSTSFLRSSKILEGTQSDSPAENQPIVVSRLRVARSPPNPITGLDGILPLLDNNNKNFPKNNVDPILKKLKLQQRHQQNKTCKLIQELKSCLSELSKECLGNLHFHTMEVFTKQWDNKLECQPKTFNNLLKTFIFEEPLKHPTARMITEPSYISQKLNQFLGKNYASNRVMLKPSPTGDATQRVQAFRQSKQQEQLSQYPTGQKGSSQMNTNNGLLNGVQAPFASQLLLLVPCVAIAVMALIALINISVCHSRRQLKN